MNGDTTESQKHPPSRRKLRRLRRDGMVARSRDLSSMLSGIAGGAALMLCMPLSIVALTSFTDTVFEQFTEPFNVAAPIISLSLQTNLLIIVLPVAGAAVIVGVLASLAFNGGPVGSFKPVIPQGQRVSPATGMKNLFGRRAWIEIGLATLRLTLWVTLGVVILGTIVEDLLFAGICGAVCIYEILLEVFWPIVIAAAVVFLIFAFLDAFVQRSMFLFEQRMTESELKRERKEQTGSPEIKSEQRRLQRKSMENAEHIGVKKATILVFFGDRGIAVRYHRDDCPIPRVAAKAVGESALARMRDTMGRKGLPEWSNEDIVKGLIGIELGDPVPPELFQSLIFGLLSNFGKR